MSNNHEHWEIWVINVINRMKCRMKCGCWRSIVLYYSSDSFQTNCHLNLSLLTAAGRRKQNAKNALKRSKRTFAVLRTVNREWVKSEWVSMYTNLALFEHKRFANNRFREFSLKACPFVFNLLCFPLKQINKTLRYAVGKGQMTRLNSKIVRNVQDLDCKEKKRGTKYKRKRLINLLVIARFCLATQNEVACV